MTPSLHPTDLLQVSLRSTNRIISSFTLTGIASLNEVLSRVTGTSGSLPGIVTIQVRNRTQGWSSVHNIVTGHRLINQKRPSDRKDSMAPLPSLFSPEECRAGA
ncbi:MAG: hypothetical protein K2K72_06120 [Duncaniella sp.]|nr:hypothetical protein [Duncaniella sp.]